MKTPQLQAVLVDQAMAGTQLLGSWVAGETLPLNEFEEKSFRSGYESLAARLPREALEKVSTASSTAMLIAGALSYGTRVIETRGRKRPPRGPRPPAPEPQAPPAVQAGPGANGHGPQSQPIYNEFDAQYAMQPRPPQGEEDAI